jgi:hypothetical protein
VDDVLCEALHDGRLAHVGLADEMGLPTLVSSMTSIFSSSAHAGLCELMNRLSRSWSTARCESFYGDCTRHLLEFIWA